MKSMSAKDAKNSFGRLLDDARAHPVVVEKHGRPVIVVLSIEEFERLKELDNERTNSRKKGGSSGA
ncbi:MAG: type II toxin-antitoxin system Phd/YefM family antitoxin [Woeseia sp.]|nr:type II toxin-antitoxin system Phd/YefM family antitoxin [Woeseia sp.]